MGYSKFRRHGRIRIDGGKTRYRPIVQACLVVFWCGASVKAADGDDLAKSAVGTKFSAESIAFFESRVRPILVDKCFKCHGEKKQSNGLRLDSREAALKGGDTGPALVAGKPDESLLVQAVAQTHAELKMPPSGKLPDSAVATLRQWVAQGAPWPAVTTTSRNSGKPGGPDVATHWAFRPVKPVCAAGCQGSSP